MTRVQTALDGATASALKAYAQLWDMSVQEVLAESVKFSMQKHYQLCPETKRIMDRESVPIDRRAAKDCFGQCCFACEHAIECRAGLYEGGWEIKTELQNLLRDPVSHQTIPLETRVATKDAHKEQLKSASYTTGRIFASDELDLK